MATDTTPGTLLAELEQCITWFEDRDSYTYQPQFAARLRARAERVREAPKLLTGEAKVEGVVTAQEFLAWLCGPLPAITRER